MWQSFVSGISHFIQYFYLATAAIGIPNYGMAIILFTVAVKILLFPLTVKQINSMRAIQELQPQIRAIQTKFKDKPDKAQQEIMKLYREAGANPLSGCLPLLFQMPILFALFSALTIFFNPVKHPEYVVLAHANFLWVDNLGKPDLIVLPVLAAISTFLQQYVTSRTASGKIDPTQRTMLIMMPLMFGWFARSFPAGLSLYWVTFNIVGIFEQLIIKRTAKVRREQASAK